MSSNQAGMLSNRLNKNQKHLSKWLQREAIHCYRLYDADIPEYAIAIDIYEDIHQARWVHVQEYAAPPSIDGSLAQKRLQDALAVITECLAVPENQIFLKVRQRQKGRAQYEKLSREQTFHEVIEAGHHFLVTFKDYLDTGLFLDHRITRSLLTAHAAGEHFLNLFAYTGSGSVYAASGEARSTTTVDMSRTYLDWAKRNMALNDFSGAGHRFIQADCLQWLEKAIRAPIRYGLIFLDPPSFSTSKRMNGTFDIQRDHVTLINNTVRLLRPGGVLIFSNNLRSFKMNNRALEHLQIKNISRKTLPKDFERNPKIHNCWEIRVATGQPV